jgi:hypothetical protein
MYGQALYCRTGAGVSVLGDISKKDKPLPKSCGGCFGYAESSDIDLLLVSALHRYAKCCLVVFNLREYEGCDL